MGRSALRQTKGRTRTNGAILRNRLVMIGCIQNKSSFQGGNRGVRFLILSIFPSLHCSFFLSFFNLFFLSSFCLLYGSIIFIGLHMF